MPELPEVETVARGLAQAIAGRTCTRADICREGLRVPFPENLKKELEGHRVEHCRRRAKYILLTLDGGRTVILHLGMSGRILLLPPGEAYEAQKHDHLILGFDNGVRMVFNDARRFGMVMLASSNELARHKAFENLGPEPLDNSFSGPVLHEAIRHKKTSIKAALMDQRVVAGLGNIYVSEALFYAGINPERLAGSLSAAETESLVRAIRAVLAEAIEAGGSTLKDYRRADGELGYFQHRFAVYGRTGESCPGCDCDVSRTGGITRINQAGRSSFLCPRKQA